MYHTYQRYGLADQEVAMPKFVIERNMAGAGKLTPGQLREAASKSNLMIRELGSEIKWLTSYVTDEKVYCVFVAPSEDIILEHARCIGLPADKISKVAATIDPGSGE
jgi:Protein of unknown function (DUF4242)